LLFSSKKDLSCILEDIMSSAPVVYALIDTTITSLTIKVMENYTTHRGYFNPGSLKLNSAPRKSRGSSSSSSSSSCCSNYTEYFTKVLVISGASNIVAKPHLLRGL
jgi:hypothetical protein